MSRGEELYLRKSTDLMSENEDQFWDDSCISAAYDKAVNKANEEIAKQIAMETNSKHKGGAKSTDKKSKSEKKPAKPKVWKEGMACRAVYEEDGLEYEAVITCIMEKECIIRFVGYNNCEIVSFDSLKTSRGDAARSRQIEEASMDKLDDGFESQSNGESASELAPPPPPPHSHGKKASKKKCKSRIPPPILEFPAMPNMPSLSTLNAAMRMPLPAFPTMPIPPPPPLMTMNDAEDEALSSMLISWYMSGYHTGLYQGMKRAKENRRH